MSASNGHAARAALGASRGKAAIEGHLREALALLAEIAAGEWTDASQAEEWNERYVDLRERLR